MKNIIKNVFQRNKEIVFPDILHAELVLDLRHFDEYRRRYAGSFVDEKGQRYGHRRWLGPKRVQDTSFCF